MDEPEYIHVDYYTYTENNKPVEVVYVYTSKLIESKRPRVEEDPRETIQNIVFSPSQRQVNNSQKILGKIAYKLGYQININHRISQSHLDLPIMVFTKCQGYQGQYIPPDKVKLMIDQVNAKYAFDSKKDGLVYHLVEELADLRDEVNRLRKILDPDV